MYTLYKRNFFGPSLWGEKEVAVLANEALPQFQN
jgi:hypothetical protein